MFLEEIWNRDCPFCTFVPSVNLLEVKETTPLLVATITASSPGAASICPVVFTTWLKEAG